MHHRDTLKTITRVYLSNRECSFQKVVYNILTKFTLKIIFLAIFPVKNKTCEYQSDELAYNLIENNHEEHSYSKINKLMISWETIQCRKVRQILQYHVPNKLLFSEKSAHHVLFLLYDQRWDRIATMFSTNVTKQSARGRSSGCCKPKQNKV